MAGVGLVARSSYRTRRHRLEWAASKSSRALVLAHQNAPAAATLSPGYQGAKSPSPARPSPQRAASVAALTTPGQPR